MERITCGKCGKEFSETDIPIFEDENYYCDECIDSVNGELQLACG